MPTHFARTSVVCLALTVGSAASAFGATLSFDGPDTDPYLEDGFAVSDPRIVNGNCTSPSGAPCIALNDTETSTVTRTDASTFSATSFWFQLLGAGTDNTLSVTSSAGGSLTLSVSEYDHNDGGQIFDFTSLPDFGTLWSDISSLTFSTLDGGNVRIDDIALEGGGGASEIPLPGAAAGLLAALGLMGLLRKRKRLLA